MNTVSWIRTGALLLAAAVALGAFGAHGLRSRLDTQMMAIYEKAVWYHTVHALALLISATLAASQLLGESALTRISLLFAGGVCLFSGSLYLLAVTGTRWLGMITPFGGVAFIAAWLVLAFSVGKS